MARLEATTVTTERAVGRRQQLTLAGGCAGADAAVGPQSTRLTAADGRAQTGGVPLYGIPLDIYVNTVELKT